MPDGPTDLTTDILIAIRDDISSFRISVEGQLDRVEGRLDLIEGRLEQLEQTSREYRREAAAVKVAGDFDERVSAVEARVTALEAPKG